MTPTSTQRARRRLLFGPQRPLREDESVQREVCELALGRVGAVFGGAVDGVGVGAGLGAPAVVSEVRLGARGAPEHERLFEATTDHGRVAAHSPRTSNIIFVIAFV